MAIAFTLTGAEFANAGGYALRVGAIVPCSRPAARIGTRKVALDALWNRSLAGKGISSSPFAQNGSQRTPGQSIPT